MKKGKKDYYKMYFDRKEKIVLCCKIKEKREELKRKRSCCHTSYLKVLFVAFYYYT